MMCETFTTTYVSKLAFGISKLVPLSNSFLDTCSHENTLLNDKLGEIE